MFLATVNQHQWIIVWPFHSPLYLLFFLRRILNFHQKPSLDNISARHQKKQQNLNNELGPAQTTERKEWVINLSSKPLSTCERSILEKGPKFAPTPLSIPHKNIVAEIEAASSNLPDESKDAIRTSAASLLQRSQEYHR